MLTAAEIQDKLRRLPKSSPEVSDEEIIKPKKSKKIKVKNNMF